MKRIAVLLFGLLAVACSFRGRPIAKPVPAATRMQPTQAAPQPQPEPVQAPAPPPREEGPDLAWLAANLTRDQLRDGLLRLMNGPGADPGAKLAAVFARLGSHPYGPPALHYAQADLDGNGEQEYVMALRIIDSDRPYFRPGVGAGLFVIYRKDGRWAVDRTDPMSDRAEVELMQPALNAVSDLTGTGRPQIVWSRPEMIATGRQPTFFFVTAWKPGAFTHLPGEMAISNGVKAGAQPPAMAARQEPRHLLPHGALPGHRGGGAVARQA